MKRFLLFLNFLFVPLLAFAQEETTTGMKSIQNVTAGQLETVKNLIELLVEFCVKYSFQVIGGVIVLILGWIVGKYLSKFAAKFLEKQNVDVTVSKFIVSAVYLMVMVFALIVALGKFGIEIAPLIAGISVAGFGLSFALQGPLSNYAAGATLIFTKPFKVGDIIEAAGELGEVIDIKLPRTELKTVDGTIVIIPNKHIIGEVIQNYSGAKRLDVNVGVSYKADLGKAIELVKDVIKKDNRVLKQPNVGISAFADSSVNIYARIWCKQDDYWNVMFDINKNIFDAFGLNGIVIPFPQRDVHLFKEK